jgi:predicted nucleic acid-binding protein
VLSEVATRLRARTTAAQAVAAARDLLHSKRYEVVFADASLFTGGLDRLERFADRRLSLTDAVSFEVMERLGLVAAFTFDGDFRACGFEMRP